MDIVTDQPRPALSAALSGAKQRAAHERCEALVRHARAQIVAVGVDRFSINEVLRAAGGSKATLAKYFGDRSGLIGAAVEAEARDAMAGMALEGDAGLPLAEALENALSGVLRFYLKPGSIALYRAVIAAADPKAASGFYHQGHRVVVDTLAALIDARKAAGEVRTGINSRDVADQLLHAVRAGLYERRLIGLADTAPSPDEISDRVRSTVALALPALRSLDRPLSE